MKTIQRLKQFIDYKGLNYSSFDKVIGVSNGYVGKQIRSGASVGSDVLESIASAFPELNMEWLLTGAGEMVRPGVGRNEKRHPG